MESQGSDKTNIKAVTGQSQVTTRDCSHKAATRQSQRSHNAVTSYNICEKESQGSHKAVTQQSHEHGSHGSHKAATRQSQGVTWQSQASHKAVTSSHKPVTRQSQGSHKTVTPVPRQSHGSITVTLEHTTMFSHPANRPLAVNASSVTRLQKGFPRFVRTRTVPWS
jgi:hypothetical protein